MRILLLEDDRKAARLLARGLEEEGFVVDVDLVASLNPVGKVFDQVPNVGIFRPAGSTVQIRVASPLALQMVAVPILVGKAPAQAPAPTASKTRVGGDHP